MTYRELPKSEWSKLQPIFDEMGGTVPALGRIIVAEDNDEIKGFFVAQLITHVEPLWISDPRVSIRRLVNMLSDVIGNSDFVTTTSNDKAERLASRFGLIERPWKVFTRR